MAFTHLCVCVCAFPRPALWFACHVTHEKMSPEEQDKRKEEEEGEIEE